MTEQILVTPAEIDLLNELRIARMKFGPIGGWVSETMLAMGFGNSNRDSSSADPWGLVATGLAEEVLLSDPDENFAFKITRLGEILLDHREVRLKVKPRVWWWEAGESRY